MRRSTLLAACLVIALAALVGGCSRGEPETEESRAEASAEVDAGSRAQSGGEQPVSRAAAARGVPVDETRAGNAPSIVVKDLSYAWSASPEPELRVTMKLGNTNDVRGRARGYVVVAAVSSERGATSRGTYPQEAHFEGQMPTDPAKGEHVSFRGDETVSAVIPYRVGDGGHFDELRIIVYDEEGGLLVDLGYDLAITGESTGEAEPKRVLSL